MSTVELSIGILDAHASVLAAERHHPMAAQDVARRGAAGVAVDPLVARLARDAIEGAQLGDRSSFGAHQCFGCYPCLRTVPLTRRCSGRARQLRSLSRPPLNSYTVGRSGTEAASMFDLDRFKAECSAAATDQGGLLAVRDIVARAVQDSTAVLKALGNRSGRRSRRFTARAA
jgi:hypothetical protein